MSSPLTRKSIDRSDTRQFTFSFFCDNCGKEWKSQTTAFEAGGFTSIDDDKAWQLVWAHEHSTAFEQANLEAHLQFCLCPKCGRRICDDCFDAEGPHEDICRECAGEKIKNE
ncbi:MAG: hypothetical protein FWC06_05150 [Treponema sp.]|nr:hypothetical protein [Treponema sp.]